MCARGGGGLLRERMALAAALWAAGIRAELLPAAAPSSTAQYEYARAAGIPWMVTLNAATYSAADTVVVSLVREIATNEQNRHPLLPYLRSRQYCLGVSLSTCCFLSFCELSNFTCVACPYRRSKTSSGKAQRRSLCFMRTWPASCR